MQKMKTYLLDFHLEYDENQPDIVVSVGGDGTLLYAFHRYRNRLDKTAFIGVHTGHLGFYADWTPDEIEKLVIAIAKTPYQTVEYPLLEVIIRYTNGGREARYLALNECTVKSVEGSLVMDVKIKGTYLRHSEERPLHYPLPREVQLTTNPLEARFYILRFMLFKLLKWLLLTIECSVR